MVQTLFAFVVFFSGEEAVSVCDRMQFYAEINQAEKLQIHLSSVMCKRDYCFWTSQFSPPATWQTHSIVVLLFSHTNNVCFWFETRQKYLPSQYYGKSQNQ